MNIEISGYQPAKESHRMSLESLGNLVEYLSLGDSIIARANPHSAEFMDLAALACAIQG